MDVISSLLPIDTIACRGRALKSVETLGYPRLQGYAA